MEVIDQLHALTVLSTGTHCVGSWVKTRANLDPMDLPLPSNETRSLALCYTNWAKQVQT
jgi:hypothetical protein